MSFPKKNAIFYGFIVRFPKENAGFGGFIVSFPKENAGFVGFIVSFPMIIGDVNHSYLKFPEGIDVDKVA